jgi:hypothetical protein
LEKDIFVLRKCGENEGAELRAAAAAADVPAALAQKVFD